VSANLPSARGSDSKTSEWHQRQNSRERLKLVGLLVIALVILIIAFVRFGRTIPWGAR
jgi:hypothetical protein